MALIDEIQRDIACPNCEYNLRGLAGAVVTCPECGRECDIAAIIARKWTGPWYRAPGLMKITLPAAMLFVAAVGRFLVGILQFDSFSRPFTMISGTGDVVFYAAVAFSWVWLMIRAWDVFGSIESIIYALLAHAIILAYIAGIFGSLYFLLKIVTGRESSSSFELYLIVTFIVLMVIANRGERHMGVRCIAAHLNRPFRESGNKPANDSAPPDRHR